MEIEPKKLGQLRIRNLTPELQGELETLFSQINTETTITGNTKLDALFGIYEKSAPKKKQKMKKTMKNVENEVMVLMGSSLKRGGGRVGGEEPAAAKPRVSSATKAPLVHDIDNKQKKDENPFKKAGPLEVLKDEDSGQIIGFSKVLGTNEYGEGVKITALLYLYSGHRHYSTERWIPETKPDGSKNRIWGLNMDGTDFPRSTEVYELRVAIIEAAKKDPEIKKVVLENADKLQISKSELK